MRSTRLLVLIVLVLGASACKGSDSSSNSGNTFAPGNSTATTSFSSVDLTVGTGATANTGNRVTVSYSGFLYDPAQPESKGRQFDANSAYNFTIGNGTVIKGWDQGVPGMKVGGLRRLVIPPSLGYGNQAVGTIPANSTLVFDIRLISVG
jgi:FKBP-type peptidyl-prolyl cis-trans isomerase FkpA